MANTQRLTKKFIFCVHAHQPVGNFGWVIEEAYQKSYKPFFKVLEQHPAVTIACHFSGSLLDWLFEHKPEFIDLLKKLSKKGQLEFIDGAYYEPIFGLIPLNDLNDQIQIMKNSIKNNFGQEPKGAWLAERVWDPDLTEPLHRAGVDFVILDDFHFMQAKKDLLIKGYYQTGEGDARLDVFASMKELRYLVPFGRVKEAAACVRDTKRAPDDVLVFADDIEKFGMWPNTYDWVFKEKWLDKFFGAIEKDKKIEWYTFSRYRSEFPSKGLVQIPHASYSEMMEWSGGRFYNFFDKYSESQYMRERMLFLSEQIKNTSGVNGTAPILEMAKQALYKAQCNCSYWHGVFGGLYLHHLRSSVFQNLIQADNLLRSLKTKDHSDSSGSIEKQMFLKTEHWRLTQKNITTFFDPKYGASLEELDDTKRGINLMCNLRRYKERYHAILLKETDKNQSAGAGSIHHALGFKEDKLGEGLFYDQNKRLSFMDHVFAEIVSFKSFNESSYQEAGDFIGSGYTLCATGNSPTETLSFERQGLIQLPQESKRLKLAIRKIFSGDDDSKLKAHYYLTNKDSARAHFVFGIEFNFSIKEDYIGTGVYHEGVEEWVLNDAWRSVSIKLTSDEKAVFVAAPIETISGSEGGLERTHQGVGVLLQRSFDLAPNETKEAIVTLEVI